MRCRGRPHRFLHQGKALRVLHPFLPNLRANGVRSSFQDHRDTLKQTRSRKTQVMLDELCDLKTKEQMLQEANISLKRKLQEAGLEVPLQLSWENGTGGASNVACNQRPSQSSQGFFRPISFEPSLQIGYCLMNINQLNAADATTSVNGYPPGWIG